VNIIGESEFIHRFKICIFGDGGVGKTTLTQRYLTGVFADDYHITIGMDFYVKKLIVDNIPVSLHIWDFAGEERFRFLMPSTLIGCNGALFLYDITRYHTFINIKNWITIFNESKKERFIPAILVGSKLDLDFKRSIDKEGGQQFAKEKKFQAYLECSSKTGENVEKLFKIITKLILRGNLEEYTILK